MLGLRQHQAEGVRTVGMGNRDRAQRPLRCVSPTHPLGRAGSHHHEKRKVKVERPHQTVGDPRLKGQTHAVCSTRRPTGCLLYLATPAAALRGSDLRHQPWQQCEEGQTPGCSVILT